MQQEQALQNPHFKKIWEEVIINRHPDEESLVDALLMEACEDDAYFIQGGRIGHPQVFFNDCGYAYAFNFCSDYQYENNRKISFFDDEERKKYDVNTGVLLEEYTEEVLNKERVLQHILGRPITLEDILLLFLDEKKYLAENYSCKHIKMIAIDFLSEWQLTTPLHEQSPETWEEISKLINK